ncbi:hypothetical protein E2C01_011142 [Portunus trituberculatus]|uniref:Uncharacterized protein n=1 Tax=Portunus trituberculatus TaxID=210409 RepID=A0A5B7DAH4_PORTR|nr:hypothetical protein [Portunus trituberculatus]
MTPCRPGDKDVESVGVKPAAGVKGGHAVSSSGETKFLSSTNRKFYLLHMDNGLPWLACHKTDVLAITRGGREAVLLRDGLNTPLLPRGFVHAEWIHQNKSNHSFSIITGRRHLGSWLFVYIHFLPRCQQVDTFKSLCVTLSE